DGGDRDERDDDDVLGHALAAGLAALQGLTGLGGHVGPLRIANRGTSKTVRTVPDACPAHHPSMGGWHQNHLISRIWPRTSPFREGFAQLPDRLLHLGVSRWDLP